MSLFNLFRLSSSFPLIRSTTYFHQIHMEAYFHEEESSTECKQGFFAVNILMGPIQPSFPNGVSIGTFDICCRFERSTVLKFRHFAS